MYLESLKGILAPFLGTSLGSAFVFFMKKNMGDTLQRMLNGFAAGVMAAASVWSLLLPAIEEPQDMGRLSFIPAAAGLWSGVLSGAVEPVSALLTIVAAKAVVPALPYFLSFAAGAMLYVVVAELVPEMTDEKDSGRGALFFASGFSVMMILDVAFG